ncbi:MAG: CUAEP/CCAEP-tail radical SAM (seleno)protein [Bryobacteraceae bacterium]
MRVLLISTYELGRQPFGLASPAAWLREEGHNVVCADVSRAPLAAAALAEAELIAFFLPMHTATRLALRLVERIRASSPRAVLCAYGLYAPLSEAILRQAGVAHIFGGEFEQPLVELCRTLEATGRAEPSRLVVLDRQQFRVPDRAGLPPLASYARLAVGGATKTVGYAEATRGCKHLCRHCPVVPVYQGTFRVVQAEVVLEDIRRQIAAGAQHITFGDPDFFNAPGHAVRLAEALHREWPELTYDATIKIEHLLAHRDLVPVLGATGCLFVTSAVESLDDAVLARLAKGHTRAGFLEALALTRAAGLPLAPTFIPFHPWTTLAGYHAFLKEIAELDLIDSVAPIQLAIRLLIPEGSLLLELPEIRQRVSVFDRRSLVYRWQSDDPALDSLQSAIQTSIQAEERRHARRIDIFRQIWSAAQTSEFPDIPLAARATIPYLTEPWYC